MNKPKIRNTDIKSSSSASGGEGTRGGKFPVAKPGGKSQIIKPSKPNKS